MVANASALERNLYLLAQLLLLPVLAVFFAAMGLLEDTGYLARAAYVIDRYMHRLGLHGKSFLPLCLGIGCNMPAVIGARVIEAVRWPEGFRCPRCNGAAHYVMRDGVREAFQCNTCRHQASLIVGTVFEGYQDAADQLVPGDALAYPSQEQRFGLGAQAPSGGALPYRLVAHA